MDTAHWLINAGLVTSSVLAVTANSFLLAIFCRRRGLRTVPNRFVINLLITNLLSSLLLVPFLLIDRSTTIGTTAPSNATQSEKFAIIEEEAAIKITTDNNVTDNVEIIEASLTILNATTTTAKTIDNRFLCYAAQTSTSFVTTLSIFSILLIGINQYFGVIHSLRYHFYINKCRSTVFIITGWLVAVVVAILSATTNSDATLWRFCQRTEPISYEVQRRIYSIAYFILVIMLPFSAICTIYVCIYTAAHKNSERMRKSTSATLDNSSETVAAVLPKVRSAPNFSHYVGSDADSVATSNFITSLRHKISNVSVFKYREETRAAKISVLVILLMLFCYVPYGGTLVVNCGWLATPAIFNQWVVVLLVVSNVISPFLFGYRNKRVKREIGKVLGIVKTPVAPVVNRRRSTHCEQVCQPFLYDDIDGITAPLPEVVVTALNERKSILKRVCGSSTWGTYKKCDFIEVPESCCMNGEARGSFSSASTQISNEDC